MTESRHSPWALFQIIAQQEKDKISDTNNVKDTSGERDTSESFMSCEKCHSKKINHVTRQTRRSDEGPTIMCICTECKHKWREN